jgi:putative heme iron utilization protein
MFKAAHARRVVELLQSQPAAALGTLHEGEPFVSMVPYALLPEARAFAIHVSALAAHTQDMLASPSVSLMVTAQPGPEDLPQSLARATFQCHAQRCRDGDPHYEAARRSYLARFPSSEGMFGFGDFSLFILTPRSMRHVGGFAQAITVMPPELDLIFGS